MKTLGMRHIALNVRDPQASKKFYMDVFGMQLEWEPDVDNVYLTSSGQDNLALHRQAGGDAAGGSQHLDHLGFIMPSPESVDEAYRSFQQYGVEIVKAPKTHRDGARSFYAKDPDGIVVQIIFHPPIAQTS